MLEFKTATRAAGNDGKVGEPVPFTLDGQQFTALPPTTSQFAMLISGTSSETSSNSDIIANAINFFFTILDDVWVDENGDERLGAATHLRRRLWDREDALDIYREDDEPSLFDVVEALVKEWGGRPTKQPSDFKQSQRSGGRKSTAHARHKASTRSSSAPTAS